VSTHALVIPHALAGDLLDADHLHTFTMSLFRSAQLPGDEGERRAGANILWAVQPDGFIVTSDLPATDAPTAASQREIRTDYAPDARVRFSTVLDAVARVRGRDTAVTDVRGWTTDKLAPALTDLDITGHGSVHLARRGTRLTHQHLAGTASVVDPDALAVLLRAGVGRSKAFGCGMLRVQELG
jgi:hypothetical protein